MYQCNLIKQETVLQVRGSTERSPKEKKVIFQMQNVIHCSHKLLLNHVKSGI